MATVINNPDRAAEASTGGGLLMGLLLLIVAAFLFFYFGLPAMRASSSPTFSVPDRVDVNVNRE